MGRLSVGTSGWCGLHPREFARRYDLVEFNWTFHERDSDVDHYKKVAGELRDLRLHAVLKVSGAATHEKRLRSPGQWWPQLWAKYSELQKAGVLGGLLWQLAPSHRCSRQSLAELEELAAHLPRNVLHIFEFRHSSWYEQYRDDVISLLRRWGFCMAWINIKNSDGWCGDLEDGWPSLVRTCNAAYLRLFGTKQKAIGRYGDQVIHETILPMVQGPGAPEDCMVVFAQADVPDHAKADASFLVELLGRGDPQQGRSTKWERDVLSATLGLGIGTQVAGAVQRITHRTVFVDIGRSCRAFLDANHARRAGLLDSLRIGTQIVNLEVQHLDFQNEWGIVGLSCHKASVSLGAQEKAPTEAESEGAASKKSRWARQATGDKGGGFTPAAAAAAAAAAELPGHRVRWSRFEGLAEIGEAAGSRHVVPISPEELEEQIRAKRAASRAKREERVGRWAKALVEKALQPATPSSSRSSAKRSRSEGPAALTRREEALSRRPLEDAALSRAETRKGGRLEEKWSPDLWAQVLPGEPGDGPMACSTDEYLLMQMERREGEETRCDEKNQETFGEDSCPGWGVQHMMRVEERAITRRMWRPALTPLQPLPDDKSPNGKSGRGNKIRQSDLSQTIASFPTPTEPVASEHGAGEADGHGNHRHAASARCPDTEHESVEERAESDDFVDAEEWQVCPSGPDLEDMWEEEMEHASAASEEEDVVEPSGTHDAQRQAEDLTSSDSQEWNWAPCRESWADESKAAGAEEMDQALSAHVEGLPEPNSLEAAAEAPSANPGCNAPRLQSLVGEPKADEAESEEEQLSAAQHMTDTPAEDHTSDAQPGAAPVQTSAAAPAPSMSQAPEVAEKLDADSAPTGVLHISGPDRSASAAPKMATPLAPPCRAWRGKACGSDAHAKLDVSDPVEDSLPMASDGSDEEVVATQHVAVPGPEGEEDEGEEDVEEAEEVRHEAHCCLCGMAYSLNVDASALGDFCCEDLGGSCSPEAAEPEPTEPEPAEPAEPAPEEEDVFVAVCDDCAATHVTHIDFMGLGLNFNCAMMGERCEGEESESPRRPAASAPLPARSQLQRLSSDEKRDLFERYAIQRQEERVSKKHIHKSIQQLADRKGQQERYRDNSVVTRKGERFIKVDVSLDPGPGCELGGIIGWRTKQGRRGLGIKKMTKEEADKVCISNKTRIHTKKAISSGDKKVVFENKWSKHTAGSMVGSAGGSLAKR
ncbi:unnamed protein product [Effrenium voratum]|nr:unnamed protein product [Effrenium voratum]